MRIVSYAFKYLCSFILIFLLIGVGSFSTYAEICKKIEFGDSILVPQYDPQGLSNKQIKCEKAKASVIVLSKLSDLLGGKTSNQSSSCSADPTAVSPLSFSPIGDDWINRSSKYLDSYKFISFDEIDESLKEKYQDISESFYYEDREHREEEKRLSGKKTALRAAEAVFVNGPVQELVGLAIRGGITLAKK